MESTPATLNTREKARKYHFFPRKSMFGLRKNSTLLETPYLYLLIPTTGLGKRRLEPASRQAASCPLEGRPPGRTLPGSAKYSTPLPAASGSVSSQKSCGTQIRP